MDEIFRLLNRRFYPGAHLGLLGAGLYYQHRCPTLKSTKEDLAFVKKEMKRLLKERAELEEQMRQLREKTFRCKHSQHRKEKLA